MRQQNDPKQIHENSQSMLPLFLRLYWIIGWVIPVFILGKLVIDSKTSSNVHFLWPLIPVSMIGARYFDIFKYHGFTADGKTATKGDFKSYCLLAIILSLVAAGMFYLMKFR